MPRKALQTNLDRLREQLRNTHDLDDATRRELAEVADTIDDVLGADAPDYESAHTRMQDAALRFEARHPAFARILSDVTDALAKLGL